LIPAKEEREEGRPVGEHVQGGKGGGEEREGERGTEKGSMLITKFEVPKWGAQTRGGQNGEIVWNKIDKLKYILYTRDQRSWSK